MGKVGARVTTGKAVAVESKVEPNVGAAPPLLVPDAACGKKDVADADSSASASMALVEVVAKGVAGGSDDSAALAEV